jgi:hypothetical protein
VKPIVVAYRSQEPDARDHARLAAPEGVVFYPADVRLDVVRAAHNGAPLILLGIGPVGCAELARRIAEHGLDGVAGIGLVGPEAPWAERKALCACGIDLHDVGADDRGWCRFCGCVDVVRRLPLGPLETLRAVADRARERCYGCDNTGTARANFGQANAAWFCPDCIRLVLSCHPEPARCAECRGQGDSNVCDICGVDEDGQNDCGYSGACADCSGTGRALGSSEVATEMSGSDAAHACAIHLSYTDGGLSVLTYPTRAAHDEHAIKAVIERLVQP